MIDFDFHSNVLPKPGSLLIAEPFANDDFFRRAVVLICEHNTNGTFGLILNNYIDLNFSDLTNEKLDMASRMSLGGPVDSNSLYFIHQFGEQISGSLKISDQLYLGGDFNELMILLKKAKEPHKKARFFLGYSGWNMDQLEHEIQNKFWVVMDIKSHFSLMDTALSDLWNDCLSSLGGRYTVFKNFPLNPNNN